MVFNNYGYLMPRVQHGCRKITVAIPYLVCINALLTEVKYLQVHPDLYLYYRSINPHSYRYGFLPIYPKYSKLRLFPIWECHCLLTVYERRFSWWESKIPLKKWRSLTPIKLIFILFYELIFHDGEIHFIYILGYYLLCMYILAGQGNDYCLHIQTLSFQN